MIALDHHFAFVSGRARSRTAPTTTTRFTRLVRAIPISWRIGSFAVINTVVVIVLAGMIWNGTRMLGAVWDDVRRLRESETLLTALATEAERLQGLIYQYIGEQRPETVAEILRLREAVLGTLGTQGSLLSDAVPELTTYTEQLLGAFGDLRVLQSAVTRTHRDAVLGPAQQMAGLFAAIDTGGSGAPMAPALAQARASFAATLVVVDTYDQLFAPGRAQEARTQEARTQVRRIEDAILTMRNHAGNATQIQAIDALQQQTAALRDGLDTLAGLLAKRVGLLRTGIDANKSAMVAAIDRLSAGIIASLRPALRKRPLILAVDVPRGISMNSYPGSYGQVLTNPFLNAVTHEYPDGRAGTLSVAARTAGCDDVEITVADDGVGMTDDVRQRAFDPFFTTRRDHGGTGLGLHVIFNIVTRSLGGRLVIDSAPGRGTTFRITIPRHATAAAATTE